MAAYFKKSYMAGVLLSCGAISAYASLSPPPEESQLILRNPEIVINGAPVAFNPTLTYQNYENAGRSVSITLGYLPSVRATLTESPVYDENGLGGIEALGILIYEVAVTSKNPDPIFVSVFPQRSHIVQTTVWPSSGGTSQGRASTYFMMKNSFGQVVNYGYECVHLYSDAFMAIPENCDYGNQWPSIEPFNFMMLPNAAYSITLEASVQAEATPGNQVWASAYVDPIFSFVGEPPADAKFIYSPGITQYVAPNAVPEPDSGLLVASATILGLMSRRRWH